MNILDKTIAFFDPVRAAKRAAARSMVSAYEAGGQGRRMKSWSDRGGSASSVTENIRTVRDRSRQLVRNNPWATKAVGVLATNVVGDGIVPTFGGTDIESKKVSNFWNDWAGNILCDYDGQNNFFGIQELAMRSVVESGEVFIRYRIATDMDIPFTIQILESEFCDAQKNQALENGGYIIQGVEFNSAGKRVAYWLYDRHPDDNINFSGLTAKRVLAEEIIHVYKVLRPGQVRGVPTGVQSFMRLRDFDDYEDAQLVRQKMAACQVATVYTTDIPENMPGAAASKDEEELDRMEPGQYQYLNPGEQIQFNTPPGVDNYDEYSRKILQGVASAYGITYEALANDYSNVNFSSGRMGWIEMSRNITSWQWNVLIPKLCDGVMSWFFRFGNISGKIKSIPYQWTAPRREMIDPVKETKALSDQVRSGFKSWTEAVTETGQDPRATFDQLVKDQQERDKHGLQLACDIRFDSGKDIYSDEEEEPKSVKPVANKK